MDSSTSGNQPVQQWSCLFEKCFNNRIRAGQITSALGELWNAKPIPGTQLVTIIFKSGAVSETSIDPLIPDYLIQLLRTTSVDICDILIALLAHSKYALRKSPGSKAPLNDAFFENVLSFLLRLVAASERPKTMREARRALRALGECLTACHSHETLLQMQSDGLRTPEPRVVTIFETLGTLAIALLSQPIVKADLTGMCPKDLKDRLASACVDFASLMSQWSPSQVAARLQMTARTAPLTAEKPNFSTAEIASAVADLPVSNSRVGLYVYLNAALCARSLTDDLTLFNYLHAKYQNDTQSLVVDLIVASFDVLANALQQRQSQNHILCFRSFIANKLPALITTLTGSLYPPMTAQVCIQMALGRVDVHPFPPLSSDHETINNETLKKSRQDFVQACVFFQLGSEQGFQNILGESSSPAVARVTRYVKEGLAQQCISNVHRVDELARELEGMSGNAGAISSALVETIRHFCSTKETMSLRTLCNVLSRRLVLMDIIFQYSQPTDILFPLCTLLNEWTHDEDQSEFQPPYEEFASVLLLILAVIHRYQLTESEIGVFSSDSFVLKLLNNLSNSIPIKALDEEQNKHLTKWVQGLYATDEQGETNGISDETMSHCPPQAFYLLVPTLFEQSVQACKTNVLALNTLKGGLEFLLEPFLLPSLIGGLSWLTKHSWEDNNDGEILLQILHKLLRPESISGDAQAMHQTIIAVVARPLARSLQDLQRRQPKRKDIGPLLEVLTLHLDSQRSSRCSAAELHEWCATSDGGLRAILKSIMAGLARWSSQTSINPMPHSYTHRAFIFALNMLGADEVLDVLLDEVRSQTEQGSGSVALEIATAIVCAPSSTISQTSPLLQFDQGSTQTMSPQRTLRQSLRARLDEPKELLSMETEYVEAMVRLGRRVDAQSAIPAQLSMPMTNLGLHDMQMTGTDDPTNLGDPASQSNDFAAAMDQSLNMDPSGNGNDPNDMPLDLSENLFGSAQDMSFDLSGNTLSQQQQQQQQQDPDQGMEAVFGSMQGGDAQETLNPDDDIFAGLEMDLGGDDFDFS